MTNEEIAALSFEDYAAIKAPAVNAIISDYAAAIVADAKKKGKTIEWAKAVKIAKKNIPEAFVPEWMKNLRVIANTNATEVAYLNEVLSALGRLEELMQIVHEKDIENFINEHQNDFRRMVEDREAK